MSDAQSWEAILEKGEIVLWQGRPENNLPWRISYLPNGLVGALFMAVPILTFEPDKAVDPTTWIVIILFVCFGFSIAIGKPLWDIYKQRQTWYSLTNKRAIIATLLFPMGRDLKSFPITAKTKIKLEPRSVYFSYRSRLVKGNNSYEPVGFANILNAEDVYQQLLTVQRKATK